LFEDTVLGFELGDAGIALGNAILGSHEHGVIIASLLSSLKKLRTIRAIRATKRSKRTKAVSHRSGRRERG
jgi:hypothetical protein